MRFTRPGANARTVSLTRPFYPGPGRDETSSRVRFGGLRGRRAYMITLPWTEPGPVVPLAPPYGGLKDPCVLRADDGWHLFATGCKDGYTYDLVHATAPSPEGPWTMRP